MNPISSLKGIGEKTAKSFARSGITTVEELLDYYPRDYEEYQQPVLTSEVHPDGTEVVSIMGRVDGPVNARRIRGMVLVTVSVSDPGGTMTATWFNALFMKNNLTAGSTYVFRGRVKLSGKNLQMIQPEVFAPEKYEEQMGRLLPIYPLTAGVSNKMLTKAMAQAVSNYGSKREFYPVDFRQRHTLPEYNFALTNIHFPKDRELLLQARKRLVFDEFFLFIASLRQLKTSEERLTNDFSIEKRPEVAAFIEGLPYELTGAQTKVWQEIEADLQKPYVMSRLVQGDVGSGKTIIAILALMTVCLNGLQGALMVPTEVLARQHMESMQELFGAHHIPLTPILLIGSMTAKEKREAYARIEAGEADIVIGTHALIQDKVQFRNLALVVTDEQHRFGVRQREALSDKGAHPHILVMSATPIPRTLAIILYGDLDISVIDELPANRLPIKNCVVNSSYHATAYKFIENQVREGRQAYVICPMVEENETMDGVTNVMDYEKKLREVLPGDIHTAYLHGKMKPKEKNEIMERFLAGEIQVLVSTTVIEVGVNVPNATVMMVENAERFGLAQLHQLRGRVGRGAHQSYCIFVSDTKSKDTLKRLQTLNRSNDGFYIASEDLKLRGPGDMFGIRQSGLLEFRSGDIFTDAGILKEANNAVTAVFEEDPELSLEKYQPLKKRLAAYMRYDLGNLNL